MFDPDSCRGGLNYAKLRRNYLAPPDLFRGSELCEVARPKSVNNSIETLNLGSRFVWVEPRYIN